MICRYFRFALNLHDLAEIFLKISRFTPIVLIELPIIQATPASIFRQPVMPSPHHKLPENPRQHIAYFGQNQKSMRICWVFKDLIDLLYIF